jgi:CheY-like chemotaxis protein
MSEMDGLTLARAMRSRSEWNHMRLVLLTSVGQRGDGARAREAEIQAYLTKPVRQSQLFECLSLLASQPGQKPVVSLQPLITRHTLAELSTPIKILVAEDNPVNQKLALCISSKMGYGVDVVSTGREALEALAQRPYQLVLMDCQMPEMDGFEATAQIRTNDNRLGTYTPIVTLTAHATTGDRGRCLAAGMDGYLTKPIDREALRTTLEKWGCKPMSTITNAASGDVSLEVPFVHQFDTPPQRFPLTYK